MCNTADELCPRTEHTLQHPTVNATPLCTADPLPQLHTPTLLTPDAAPTTLTIHSHTLSPTQQATTSLPVPTNHTNPAWKATPSSRSTTDVESESVFIPSKLPSDAWPSPEWLTSSSPLT